MAWLAAICASVAIRKRVSRARCADRGGDFRQDAAEKGNAENANFCDRVRDEASAERTSGQQANIVSRGYPKLSPAGKAEHAKVGPVQSENGFDALAVRQMR